MSSPPSNVTLKDIAQRTGYSLVSVHRAINGKNGVSEKSRQEILQVAQELGYEVNRMASALKRSQINVAICLPEREQYGAYYFKYIWNACRDCIAEFSGYHVNIIEQEFFLPNIDVDEEAAQLASLDELFLSHGDHLDGLLTSPASNTPALRASLQRFIDHGVKVVLIDNDFPTSGRLCCIAPNDENTGRLSAELMCSMVHQKEGCILVAAGNANSPSHRMNAMGFCDYVRTHRPELSVATINDQHQRPDKKQLYAYMRDARVIAAYSTRARNTMPICEAALSLEGERKLLLLGSDLFPESAEMLRRGVLKGIVYKNPYQKGYLGLKVLLEYLLFNRQPRSDKLMVPISIIMRNNLMFFEEFI